MTDKIVPCGFCRGTGRMASEYLNHAIRTCLVCAGRGKLKVPRNAEKCSGCNGTGMKVNNYLKISAERHLTCQGTGWWVRPSLHKIH